MVAGLRIFPETLRSRDSATFNATNQTLGSALAHPACLVKVVNNSDQLVTISWDGVNSHDVVPANSFTLYDINTNAGTERGLYIAKGVQFYVNGAAAGTGLVYLVILYIVES